MTDVKTSDYRDRYKAELLDHYPEKPYLLVDPIYVPMSSIEAGAWLDDLLQRDLANA